MKQTNAKKNGENFKVFNKLIKNLKFSTSLKKFKSEH